MEKFNEDEELKLIEDWSEDEYHHNNYLDNLLGDIEWF